MQHCEHHRQPHHAHRNSEMLKNSLFNTSGFLQMFLWPPFVLNNQENQEWWDLLVMLANEQARFFKAQVLAPLK